MRWKRVVILIVFLSGLAEIVLAAPTATLTSSSMVNLKTGESSSFTFSVSNDNSFCGVTAYYSLDSTSYDNVIGKLGAGASKSVNIQVSAPPIGSGSGNAPHGIFVKIVTDSSLFCGGEIYYPTLNLNINYDDSEYQNAKSNAQSAINSANSAINAASSGIATAQNTINAAKNIGADVSNAEVKLASAQTAYQNAQSKLSSAQNSFNQKTKQSFDLATQYSAEATNSANSAKADADNANVLATQAKEKYEKELNEAQLKLAEAQTTYNNVVSAIDQTKKIISLSSEMGIDTSSLSKELEKVTSNLIDSKAEIDKAKTRFGNKEYAESKKSSSASLEITEKHITILQNIQYNAGLAAREVITKRDSDVTSSYNSALTMLEDNKAKMTGDVYSSRKEKLDKAKANLEEGSSLINRSTSYLDAKKYYDAINSYRSVYSLLDDAESLSTSVKNSIATEQAGIMQKIVDFFKSIFKSIFG